MSQYLELDLIGADGEIWDVTHGRRGVLMQPKTQRFLGDTPARTFWIKSASRQRYQQFAYQRRDPLFQFVIARDTPLDWRDVDSDFRTSLGYYDDQFTIRATTQPDNEYRDLTIRLLQDPTSWASDWEGRDSHLYAAGSIAVDGACEQMHWAGPVETFTWTVPSNGSASTNLWFSGNPGDVPVFPRWTGNSPTSGTTIWTIPDYSWGQEADFGDAPGSMATRTVPVLPDGVVPTDGDWELNTDDDEEYIVSTTGVPLTMRTKGQLAYYPIAPKTPAQTIPVSVTGAQVGMSITLELDRFYTRAWGVRRR